jgi:hypothetical protein
VDGDTLVVPDGGGRAHHGRWFSIARRRLPPTCLLLLGRGRGGVV